MVDRRTFTTLLAAKLVKFAQAAPGQRVLDVACGAGVVAVTAARASAKASGADKSDAIAIRSGERSLHEAKKFRANQRRGNRSAVQRDKGSFYSRAMTIDSPSD